MILCDLHKLDQYHAYVRSKNVTQEHCNTIMKQYISLNRKDYIKD